MRQWLKAARYSSVGAGLVAIFATLVGCSNEDQLRALLLILMLMLTGGSAESAPSAAPPGFSFTVGTGLSFNPTFGEGVTDCAQGDFQSTLNNLQNGVMADPAGVDTTVTAVHFCHLNIPEIHFQVIVVSGAPPNLTLEARSGTLVVTTADCPGQTLCTVHFSPGLPVASAHRVGVHTLAAPLGQWGARGETTASQSWHFFTGDPAGTNAFSNAPGNRRFIDFGTP